MNKAEVVEAIAAKAGTSRAQADRTLSAFLQTEQEALRDGEDVQLVGFGTFKARQRQARTVRNPRTGAEIEIAGTVTAKFVPGVKLRQAMAKVAESGLNDPHHVKVTL